MADYAITSVARRVVYTGSAGVGPYAFSFPVLVNTDIAVYKNDTLLTLTTDYTVTISGTTGTGSVTLVVAATGADRITIVGARAIQRSTDFVTGGDFFANTLNTELDSEVIFVQQVAETAERSLKAPVTDPTTINMTLPLNTVRANKTLAFDADGNPVVGEQIGDYRGNWAAAISYNKRDLVKDTSNSNIYLCVVAHTSSGSQPISSNADVAKWSLIVDAEAANAAQVAAEAAQAAAELAETNAETAETNAETAETNAETAATNAASSASAASSSASAASSSASSASSSASAASTSETNAASSASAASTSASNASSSASSASSSASTATTQATNASTSASAASTSATNASNSASTATTQASNASTSASNAATSATNAAASEAAAEAALESFNETYLGAKATDPTLDNNGDPVTAGDWYFNTTSDRSRIYDGAAWDFVAVDTSTVVSKTSPTGSAIMPTGTTGERDVSPSAGFLRFNSTLSKPEVYNGSSWGSVGGGATGAGGDEVFVENTTIVTTSYTLTASKNALSVGPVTINSGATVTVGSGQRWLVL
jgi:hypothetical protein